MARLANTAMAKRMSQWIFQLGSLVQRDVRKSAGATMSGASVVVPGWGSEGGKRGTYEPNMCIYGEWIIRREERNRGARERSLNNVNPI